MTTTMSTTSTNQTPSTITTTTTTTTITTIITTTTTEMTTNSTKSYNTTTKSLPGRKVMYMLGQENQNIGRPNKWKSNSTRIPLSSVFFRQEILEEF